MVDKREGIFGAVGIGLIAGLIRWAIGYIKGYFDRRAKREQLALDRQERADSIAADRWDAYKKRQAAHEARAKVAAERRRKEWERIRPEAAPIDDNPYK